MKSVRLSCGDNTTTKHYASSILYALYINSFNEKSLRDLASA